MGATTASSRPLPLIGGYRGFGVRQARNPLGLHTFAVVGHGLGFLALSARIGLAVLVRQLTRMHDHQPAFLSGDPSVAVLDFDLAHPTVSMPAAWGVVRGTPGLCHHEREEGWLLAPGCACLAHRPGAWHQGHPAHPLLQTQPQRAPTLRLTLGDNPVHPRQAQRQTRLNRQWGFHPLTPVPIPQPQASRSAPIAAHPETQEPLFESVPALLARPVGWPGGPWGGGVVFLRSVERNGRGVLRQRGRRDGVALQGLEGNGAPDLVESGGQQRIAAGASPVIMERRACQAWLAHMHHPPLVQPLSHCVERMIAIQHRQDQGVDPMPRRAHMARMGREKAVDNRGDLSTS